MKNDITLSPSPPPIFFSRTFNRFDEINDLYSGFYTYHINTNTWNMLYVDQNHQLSANPEFLSIKARILHAMLFDDVSIYFSPKI